MLPRWIDVVVDAAGNSMRNVAITVTTWKGAVPTLYADRDGQTPLPSNVVSTDWRGQYTFFAPAGHYLLTTSNATTGQVIEIGREIVLAGGDLLGLTPEYFGIFPGTTIDITRALQAWHDEIIQASHVTGFPSGDVRSGVIRLPYMNATCDSLLMHPAVSVIGDVRGGTSLTMKAGATPVGVDNIPAMFYVVARARSDNSNPAWMPEYRGLRMDGNGNNQTVDCSGIYCEPVANDNTGSGFSPIGYSAILGANCDLANFSGDGVVSGAGRQRITLTDRFRSSMHGRYDGSGNPLNTAHAYKIVGNQGVLIGVGGGQCSGHSLLASGTSGLLVLGCNIWGADSGSRSAQAVAMYLYNCNGFAIKGNVINDTVSIDGGGSNNDRSSEISGNQMKPNDPVFTADGVTSGTADISYNCHVRIARSLNIAVGPNGYGAGGSTGYRYQNILCVCNGAQVYADIPTSSYWNPGATPPLYVKPWASTSPIPILEQDTATCYYRFSDINLGASWTNLAQGGVETQNQVWVVKNAPDTPTVIAPTQERTWLKFSGTQAAVTLQLPYPPLPGVIYRVITVNAITALSVTLSSQAQTDGETIVSAPTTLAAGASFGMVYRPSTQQWWPA